VNSSGVFVVTHTSGTPSYTIKATTDSLGLADSSVVTKNIGFNLTAPTLSSPANVGTLTDVAYTITSTDSNDDKIILDMGSSNFNFSSVSVGTASKVGNTVECIGFTTNNPAVTIQFTAEATYSVTAKSVDTGGTYGDSPLSSADSITIVEWSAYNIDYLVIAGGGGGDGFGGGGGAGGYRNSYNSETSGGNSASESAIAASQSTAYTITVGNGAAPNGYDGGNSVFGSITSVGGGAGGDYGNPYGTLGSGGGSGGGGGSGESGSAAVSGGAETSGQGHNGGTGYNYEGRRAGGGGGAGGAGGNGAATYISGNGGNGLASSITGSSITRAGGGGGGQNIGAGGSGGYGGSGGGGSGRANAGNGLTNYGGGGGGRGGSGGSGVVILRMPTSGYSGTTTGSPTVDSSTVSGTTILTFNGDGTYTG
jgi:hypothetical protein